MFKLNRAIWVSLLEQENLTESVAYYESYIDGLSAFKKNKKMKDEAENEIILSESYLTDKLYDLAQEYFNNKDYPNALICYTVIFKYRKNEADILENYITCLEKLMQYDLADELINYVKQEAFSDYKLYKAVAAYYDKRGDNYLSTSNYEQYLKKKSKITSEEYNLLGCYYNKLYSEDTNDVSDAKKSMDSFKMASDMEPDMRIFAKNTTIMATKINDTQTGRKYWNRMFEINDLNNDDKYDYAAYCLKHSDFEGWHKYSGYRFQKEHNATTFPKISKPEWTGKTDISNSTLLVFFEQGYGDTFLTYGYISRLKKLAKHVIFVVQNSVYPLLKDNDSDIEIIANSKADLDSIEFDYYIPAMSIITALNLDRSNISAGGGYIKVRDELVNEFGEKYCKNNKLKVGISCRGSVSGNKTRNIPIEELLPIDDLSDIEIYSLSIDLTDKDLDCFSKHRVVNVIKSFDNFEQTAALMQNMDIILTSDNCILNLAGALGKKTFALFNWNYDFRWFDLSGDDVVYYNSVKPFVNDRMNNWSSSVNAAAEAIKKIQSVAV